MHLADLHIGKKVSGFSMIDEQKAVLEQIKKIASDNDVSVVMIAGDVYDKNTPSAEAVTLFDDFLTSLVKMNIKVLIISGNHDSIERLSFASALMESSNVYISKQFNGDLKKVTFEDDYGNINFYLLPFIRPIDVKNAYENTDIQDYNDAVKKIISKNPIDTLQRNVILSHQFITNAEISDSEMLSVGGIDNVEAENYKNFDYAALGHIHKPQKIRDNIRYSGSILKYSFSECKIDKSVPIIDMQQKGSTTIELFPLIPKHDMIEIKGTYNELMSPDYYKNIDTQSYVHVILTNDTAEPDAMNKLRTVYPNIMKIDYCNITTESEQEIEDSQDLLVAKPIEFVRNFYEEMYGKSMNDNQEKYINNIIEEIWG